MPLVKSKTTEKMISVKAALDKALEGPEKDAALKHYRAAEEARVAQDDTEANEKLDAATHALG